MGRLAQAAYPDRVCAHREETPPDRGALGSVEQEDEPPRVSQWKLCLRQTQHMLGSGVSS
eukprot:2318458-Rhodomonas_salina.1